MGCNTTLDTLKRAKWDNTIDSIGGWIGMSISSNLQFHLQGIETPNVA